MIACSTAQEVRMKTVAAMAVVLVCLVAGTPCFALDATPVPAYTAIEINRFDVNREDYSSKEAERAGRVPDEMLETIQRIIIAEFTKAQAFPKVGKPGVAAAEELALELGGKVLDFKAGNKTARYFVGMGAGQQKIEIECVLKDKKTGSVLAREVVLDRKVGGIAGGDEEKGVRDFAEKVVVFVQKTLHPPKP
jgi:hypothetical protein